MKLYYAPGACSLAVHIALREAGLGFDCEKVDLAAKQTASGQRYTEINPKGYVPALRLDDGSVLTEASAVLQYVADRADGLLPQPGTMERYRVIEWLGFISTELHKGFGPLWNPKAPEETKQSAREQLARRFDYVASVLDGRPYLTGEEFTVADAYLFTVLNWTRVHRIDLGRWANLRDYQARVAARPAVLAAMRAEGLQAA